MLAGEIAFKLYDTYGFPLDLTQDALRARGIGVDLAGFDAAMERQRAKARASLGGLGRGRDRDGLVRAAREARRHRIPRLRDRERRGRGRRAGQGRQGGRRAEEGRERRGGDQPDAVLCRVAAARSATPARCGARACGVAVTDTQKKAGDLFVHMVKVEEGALKVGDPLLLEVDHARRARHPRQPFRHASAARGAAPGARRSCGAEGLAGRARPAALRLLAPQADDGRTSSSASRTSPTTSCCRMRR